MSAYEISMEYGIIQKIPEIDSGEISREKVAFRGGI